MNILGTRLFPRSLLLALAFLLCLYGYAPKAFARDTPTPPVVGGTAPDFQWTSLDGRQVTLSKLTAQGPVVLILLRGFPGYQCPFCTAQVGELVGNADRFKAARTQVVLVYPGPADGLKQHAGDFVKGKTIPDDFTLVLDPDFAFTNKYGLRWDGPQETSYPSTFVLDTKGKVVFAKISHSHGDRAHSAEILEALKKIAPTSPKNPQKAMRRK